MARKKKDKSVEERNKEIYENLLEFLIKGNRKILNSKNKNLLKDFEAIKTSLSNVAGSLKLCNNTKLRKLGYRRNNFLSHRYFMLYRIENDTVYVDNIFHELQDYENIMS